MHANELWQRWQAAGAREWVEAQAGTWNHDDWLALLNDLRRQGLAGVDVEAVGRVLERCKVEYWNLRRWLDSGEAWRWVEAHGGEWGHHDWMTLLAGLQCWLGPLDPVAVGQVLEVFRRQYHALQRWVASGAPARWVEEHGGQWDHADWLELLASLERSPVGPLPAEAVGKVLERRKVEYWNLRRWVESGEPARWVEAQRGRWGHADWLRLLAGLERSEFWPIPPEEVGRVLERARKHYEDLQRWQQSGAARLWVAMRGGRWDDSDVHNLLAVLEQTERLEVSPAALNELLEKLRAEYEALRRWLERVPPVVRRGSGELTTEGALLLAGHWQRGAWQPGPEQQAA